MTATSTSTVMRTLRTIPILRIFDEAKAREFYVDYLGFKIDWEHRFEPGTPLYMQVSLGELVLHLSEHYGDGTPGSAVYVSVRDVEAYHAQLAKKGYKYLRPGLGVGVSGMPCLDLRDPFGNQLRFDEANDA